MEWRQGPNLPIDTFFCSLAKDCSERAIAIALSGTGGDGTRGIREIKEAGGLVMILSAGDLNAGAFTTMKGAYATQICG